MKKEFMFKGNTPPNALKSEEQNPGYYETLRVYHPLLFFFALLILLSFLHIYPQEAYPLRGLFIISGIFLVLCGIVLMGTRGSRIPSPGKTSLFLYGVFLVWCIIRNITSPVPALGRQFVAMVLEGFWVFAGVQIALTLEKSPGASDEKPFGVALSKNMHFSTEVLSLRFLAVLYFFFLALLFSLYGIYQYFIGFEKQLEMVKDTFIYSSEDKINEGIVYALREKRISAKFGNANLFAAFLSLSFPFVLFFLFKIKDFRKKVGIPQILIIGVLVLLFLFVLILSQSRGGILSFIVAAICFVLIPTVFSRDKPTLRFISMHIGLKKFVLVFVLIIGAVLVFTLVQNATRDPGIQGGSFIQRLFRTTTLRERGYYLKTGWEIIKQNPVLGSGPAGYELNYPGHRCLGARETKYAHNMIIQIWAELGFVGLILFLVFTGHLLCAGFHNLSKRKQILPALVAAIVFLFNSLFEYSFFHASLYLDFCICAGLIIGTTPMEREKKKARKTLQEKMTRSYFHFMIPVAFSFVLLPFFIIRPFYAATQAQFGDDAILESNKQKALDYYKNATIYQPDHPWYLQRLGRVQMDRGNLLEAERHLKKAAELNPLSALLADELAKYYESLFRTREAVKWEEKAAKAYPLNAYYHFRLAILYKKLQRTKEAIRSIKEAIRVELSEKNKQKYKNLLKELEPQ